MESSPVTVRLENRSHEYFFFQFTLVLNNILLFDNSYNARCMAERLEENFDFEAYTELQSKFMNSDEDPILTTELSIIQINSLLKFVDNICKALLTGDADTFRSIVSKKFPDIKEGWDLSFLKSAQYIFKSFRKRFENIPQPKSILEIIARQEPE